MRFAVLITAKVFACILLLAGAAPHVSAKAWRGIQPLHSTKQDVIRLFNQCVDANESCEFDLSGEHVYILFSNALGRGYRGCIGRLPPEAVLYVEVKPFARMPFADLAVKLDHIKSFNPATPHRPGFKAYFDKKEGWLINTYQGEVDKIVFIAAAEDIDVCRSYYRDPKRFVRVEDIACAGLPPTVILDCPAGNPDATEKINLTANYSGDTVSRFIWSVSGGKIVDGQGTNRITLDAEGSEKTIEVTVAADDGNGHQVSTSCQIKFRSRKELSIPNRGDGNSPF